MSVHITPHKNGWQVLSSKADKAYRVVSTQNEAIEIAKEVAKNQKTDVKIHGKNGRIRVGYNYAETNKKSK